jgi:hypothetical protein
LSTSTPLRRAGQLDEVTATVAFFAFEDAGYVSGGHPCRRLWPDCSLTGADSSTVLTKPTNRTLGEAMPETHQTIGLTEEHQALREVVRKFVDERVIPTVQERDARNE